jgi:hypothetical protein
MNIIQKIKISAASLSLILLMTSTASAAATGNFAITNNDFKEIFNNHRYATPKNIPWAGSYWAYGRDGLSHMSIKGQLNNPPAMKYDAYWGVTDSEKNTHFYEMESHSCSQFNDDPVTQKSCEGWWGHCNAWAAAAIKEPEPRTNFISKNQNGQEFEITVADQKGLLSELWMSSGSLFAGDTHKGVTTNNLENGYLSGTKEWIFDENDGEGQKRTRSGATAYQAFWDVTPRTFFLIFTNYVGIKGTGVVIDRFTGDQVWNQPIVGYRILPIQAADIKEVEVSKNGQKRYPVLIKMKMFWAEDGVHEYEVSDKFTIDKTDDKIRRDFRGQYEEEKFGHHYTGRLLQFILFFDSALEISDKGTRIVNAGNIVGEGMWGHKTRVGASQIANMDNAHPDFIWLPTNVSDQTGNRNPLVKNKYVRYIWDNKVGQGSVNSTNDSNRTILDTTATKAILTLINYNESFPRLIGIEDDQLSLKKRYIAHMISKALEREGITAIFTNTDEIKLENTKAIVTLNFANAVNLKSVSKILSDSGIIAVIK